MGSFSLGETLCKSHLDNWPLASLEMYILQRFVELSLTLSYVVIQVYNFHNCIFLWFQLVGRAQIV